MERHNIEDGNIKLPFKAFNRKPQKSNKIDLTDLNGEIYKEDQILFLSMIFFFFNFEQF